MHDTPTSSDTISAQCVVGLGELLWDCFADGRRPGGAPANVAFHANQIGHRGMVCSRVGDDDLGRELVDYLKERGLDDRFVQIDSAHPTGTVTVDTRDASSPRFTIHEDVAWDHLTFGPDLEELAADAAAICFGTLAQRYPQTRETIVRCLDAATSALCVYDVNLRPPWFDRAWIVESLKRCHVIKLNHDEVTILADLLDVPGDSLERFAAAVRDRFDVEMVCVTRGANGCALFAADAQPVDIPGKPVQVADTVGAGDAFTAALISGRLRGWPLPTIGAFANHVGALVAGRPGAMPDINDEIQQRVQQVTS